MGDWTGTVPTILAGDIVTGDNWDTVLDILTALTVAWTSYTPTWTSTGTQPVLGNGTIVGQYVRLGKFVVYRGRLDMGTTTTFGTGIWNFSLPVAFNTSGGQVGVAYLSDATGITYPAVAAFFGSNLFLNAVGGNVIPTVPFTWAQSDNLLWTAVYEST